MKATTYKTGNVMRSLVVSLIILASLSGIAKGENSGKEAIGAGITLQIASYNANDFAAAEIALETENWLNNNGEVSNEVDNIELVPQIEKYNAQDFVEKEIAIETETWMNMPLNHAADDSIKCNMACQ